VCDFPYSLAVTSKGIVFTANECVGIFELDPVSGNVATISTGGLICDPLGVAVTETGDILVSDAACPAHSNQGALIRIDHVSGAQTLVLLSEVFTGPTGVGQVVIPTVSAAAGQPCIASTDLFPCGGSGVRPPRAIDLHILANVARAQLRAISTAI